jgi:hypothetical protein
VNKKEVLFSLSKDAVSRKTKGEDNLSFSVFFKSASEKGKIGMGRDALMLNLLYIFG